MLPHRDPPDDIMMPKVILKGIASSLMDLFLPPHCHLCNTPVSGSEPIHICKECIASLPIITGPVCSTCGIPFKGAGSSHVCGRCITSPPPYKAARAAMLYEAGCRDMIHSLKYNGKTPVRRPLALLTAKLLADFVASCAPDFIVPVPLHVSRLRTRGFNQSILLGEVLSSEWGVPLLRQGLIRNKPTIPQVELSREQRLSNLRGVFEAKEIQIFAGKKIIMIDDVFTTGSTLSESAKAILDAGASEVFAATVAHAP